MPGHPGVPNEGFEQRRQPYRFFGGYPYRRQVANTEINEMGVPVGVVGFGLLESKAFRGVPSGHDDRSVLVPELAVAGSVGVEYIIRGAGMAGVLMSNHLVEPHAAPLSSPLMR